MSHARRPRVSTPGYVRGPRNNLLVSFVNLRADLSPVLAPGPTCVARLTTGPQSVDEMIPG
jgi:hypothetical protein